MTKYFLRVIAIVFCFALQTGLSALTPYAWTPAFLAVLTVVAIWRDRQDLLSSVILPSALLVDLVHPVQFPLVSLTVLCVWGVSWLVQRSWLTNRSTASLMGLALVAALTRVGSTAGGLALANLFGFTTTSVRSGWQTGSNSILLGVEICSILCIGILWQWISRHTHQRFFYGAR